MIRRPKTILLSLLAVTLLAAPVVLAQAPQFISVEDQSFEWTGKEGRTANFSWSATIANPTKRPNVELAVTLTLVDGAGNVVGTDSTTLTVDREGQADVRHAGSLPYDDAAMVENYRVSVESANR